MEDGSNRRPIFWRKERERERDDGKGASEKGWTGVSEREIIPRGKATLRSVWNTGTTSNFVKSRA
jgi:hypothetical protein